MCGEKCPTAICSHEKKGSPPRVRGKGGEALALRYEDGITPACAGKRCASSRHTPRNRDHPRVCGEKAFRPDRLPNSAGSPPRVRGKESAAMREIERSRITPACAGKRAAPPLLASSGGDHPRVCGEKLNLISWAFPVMGSPPRVRGKDGWRGTSYGKTGITPACAGKSRAVKSSAKK